MIALIIIIYIILGIIVGSVAYPIVNEDPNDSCSGTGTVCFLMGLCWPFVITGILLFKLGKLISYYTINTVYIRLYKITISDKPCFICKHYRNNSKLCKMDFETKKCENFQKDKFWKFKYLLK